MTGKRWTIGHQAVFLDGYILQYLKAKADGSQSVFWPLLYRAWFERYSEREALFLGLTTLTEEQEDALKSKIETRHKVSRVYCIDDTSLTAMSDAPNVVSV